MATAVSDERRMRLIRPFGDLGREDVAYAGGKGANLVDAAERRVLLDAARRSEGGAR